MSGKSCSYPSCSSIVAFKCNSCLTSTCFCKKHVVKHMFYDSQHSIIPVIFHVNCNDKEEIRKKTSAIRHYFQTLRKDLNIVTSRIINSAENEAEKTLKKIRETEKMYLSIYKLSEQGKKIDRELLEYVKKIQIPEESDLHERSEEKLNAMIAIYNESLFDMGRTWKDCDKVIYCEGYTKLLCIDLRTLRRSVLSFTPNIGTYAQACKISKDCYFINGGYNGSASTSETFIINIKAGSYESLASSTPRRLGGCTYNDNKVYRFGGHTSKAESLSDCFDLNTKKWNQIANLPSESYHNTAAVTGNKIIVSGYHLNCALAFDGNTYTPIINLAANCYKIVAEGYILVQNTLYAYLDGEWQGHNIGMIWDKYCWIYLPFKRGRFIYFVETTSGLMRINTVSFKLEKVPIN